MSKQRVYFSHSIRGKLGSTCPIEIQEKNCAAAIEIANEIRWSCPEFDIYVPAEHEEFIMISQDLKYLTEKQILEIDCVIVDRCDITIVYVPEGDKLQGGRKIEFDHVRNTGKPVIVYATAEEAVDFLRSL